MKELKFRFLNRSVPVFPAHIDMVIPKERMFLKIQAPLFNEISGLGIIKLLGLDTYHTLTLNVNFVRNKAF